MRIFRSQLLGTATTTTILKHVINDGSASISVKLLNHKVNLSTLFMLSTLTRYSSTRICPLRAKMIKNVTTSAYFSTGKSYPAVSEKETGNTQQILREANKRSQDEEKENESGWWKKNNKVMWAGLFNGFLVLVSVIGTGYFTARSVKATNELSNKSWIQQENRRQAMELAKSAETYKTSWYKCRALFSDILLDEINIKTRKDKELLYKRLQELRNGDYEVTEGLRMVNRMNPTVIPEKLQVECDYYLGAYRKTVSDILESIKDGKDTNEKILYHLEILRRLNFDIYNILDLAGFTALANAIEDSERTPLQRYVVNAMKNPSIIIEEIRSTIFYNKKEKFAKLGEDIYEYRKKEKEETPDLAKKPKISSHVEYHSDRLFKEYFVFMQDNSIYKENLRKS